MPPERFSGLKPGLAGLLLPIAREAYPEQLTALAWWSEDRRATGLILLSFAAELYAIPRKVTDPTLGAIRFAFWREVLEEALEGRARAHPVAEALLALRGLPGAPEASSLSELLEAAEVGLSEAEGASAPGSHELDGTLLPILAIAAGAEAEEEAQPLAALGHLLEAGQEKASSARWEEAWRALLPLSEAMAPIAGATRLTRQRRLGRPVSAFRQRLSLLLTILRGR